MIPSIARIVLYKLTDEQAARINARRYGAKRAKNKVTYVQSSGSMEHVGHDVYGGEQYPMIITKIWSKEPHEKTMVNGQVLLDGNDTLWVTSTIQGPKNGEWLDPREA